MCRINNIADASLYWRFENFFYTLPDRCVSNQMSRNIFIYGSFQDLYKQTSHFPNIVFREISLTSLLARSQPSNVIYCRGSCCCCRGRLALAILGPEISWGSIEVRYRGSGDDCCVQLHTKQHQPRTKTGPSGWPRRPRCSLTPDNTNLVSTPSRR